MKNAKLENRNWKIKNVNQPSAISHWLLAKKFKSSKVQKFSSKDYQPNHLLRHKGTKAQRNVACLPVQTGEFTRNIESKLSCYNFSFDVPRNPACLCACLLRLRRRQVNPVNQSPINQLKEV
jgi:ribosomal protein L35